MRSTMKTSRTWWSTSAREETVVRNLASAFTSALGHRKSRDGGHAIPGFAQRIDCFAHAKAQRADDAGSHNCHTSSGRFPIHAAKLTHREETKLTPDFLLLSFSKHFTSDSKAETEARKLVDCQLSLFSDDLKSDKREQVTWQRFPE